MTFSRFKIGFRVINRFDTAVNEGKCILGFHCILNIQFAGVMMGFY